MSDNHDAQGAIDRVATIVRLERAGWNALTTDAGWRFFDELMTVNALMVFDVATLRRDDVLSRLREAPPWTSYQLAEVQVVELDAHAALVTYDVRAQRSDDVYHARASSAFVLDGAQWRLAFHQQTPLRSYTEASGHSTFADGELNWIPEHAVSMPRS